MTELLDLTIDEVLSTTRNVRKRLDLTRPVERAVLEECLELALQAPNGSNSQSWEWIVVDDPKVKAEVARLQREALAEFRGDRGYRNPAKNAAISGRNERVEEISESVMYLIDRFDQVPFLVVPAIRTPGRLENKHAFYQASQYGSILQAVWSMMLALRARGLGSAWTTLLMWREKELAELLGLDYANYTLTGVFPVAYTVGTEFKPAQRAPLSQVLHYNSMTPRPS